VWIKGSLNVEVDVVSRWVDTNDWRLRLSALSQICLNLGLWVVDRFADHTNATVLRFNSLFAVLGLEAVDAFSQSWVGSVSLLVPPFALILRVLQHLVEDRAIAILFCPLWEAQPWWPILLRVSSRSISLGRGHQATVPGPSGVNEPARGQWQMQAHLVDGSRFQTWRA
jgi:hypothetical protein